MLGKQNNDGRTDRHYSPKEERRREGCRIVGRYDDMVQEERKSEVEYEARFTDKNIKIVDAEK